MLTNMVQYIITPWRNRQELLSVRRIFYPASNDERVITDEDRYRAVARVSLWVQRGNCPHAIESTALLVSATLNDKITNSAYAMRAAYSAAFCRFVTGLLDGYQDKRHKMSMYLIAKNIGLPATFVELRHQCTHEELPSLQKLRSAAKRSLNWIWEHYWQTLDQSTTAETGECRQTLQRYLQLRTSGQQMEVAQLQAFSIQLQRWDTTQVIEILDDIADSATADTGFVLQALKLSRAILSGEVGQKPLGSSNDDTSINRESNVLEDIRADMARAAEALKVDEGEGEGKGGESVSLSPHVTGGTHSVDPGPQERKGWIMWEGPWAPKPIGTI